MATFQNLVTSRKEWISSVLIPWCQAASLQDLRRAEQEWGDIAGRVTPEHSLWLWAWSRYPALYDKGLTGLDETWHLRVTLKDGTVLEGFADNQQSERGQLVLVSSREDFPPVSLDEIESVERLAL